MSVLVLGAGNLLLSDEGFGVHVVHRIEQCYAIPAGVELLDAGTMGIMISSRIEDADIVFIVDVVDAPGEPGTIMRYDKDDFMLNRIPVKLSPHQMGVQEMLLVSELRGRCPRAVRLIGIIPATLEPGNVLSPAVAAKVDEVVEIVMTEICAYTGFPLPGRQGAVSATET